MTYNFFSEIFWLALHLFRLPSELNTLPRPILHQVRTRLSTIRGKKDAKRENQVTSNHQKSNTEAAAQ